MAEYVPTWRFSDLQALFYANSSGTSMANQIRMSKTDETHFWELMKALPRYNAALPTDNVHFNGARIVRSENMPDGHFEFWRLLGSVDV
jgi:hypothetical protein